MLLNYPFGQFYPGNPYRPLLNLWLTNPENQFARPATGLIDTGADRCAIPAWLARELGHEITNTQYEECNTASGITRAYKHTFTIDIFDIENKTKLLEVHQIKIDVVEGLQQVLIGVDDFLAEYILTICYPDHFFSIQSP